MATQISDTTMASNQTRHTATATRAGWEVTWLPGRALTRNQAVTAMTIAEWVTVHRDALAGGLSPEWVHLAAWAGELGLTPERALLLASKAPEEIQDGTVTP